MRTLVLVGLFIINDYFEIITEVSLFTSIGVAFLFMGVVAYDIRDFLIAIAKI